MHLLLKKENSDIGQILIPLYIIYVSKQSNTVDNADIYNNPLSLLIYSCLQRRQTTASLMSRNNDLMGKQKRKHNKGLTEHRQQPAGSF